MNDPKPVTATYQVPESRLEELKSSLDKLAKQASKLGVTPITYSLGEPEDRPFLKSWSVADKRLLPYDAKRYGPVEKFEDGPGLHLVYIRFFPVTVSGATPRLAGWSFVATLQHLTDDKGEVINLLRTIPTFEGELPEKYRTASAENCDHCHKAIKTRKETFVVRHDDGTWKQVGRNCTQDFLGGKDPHEVTKALELLMRAMDLASSAEGDDGWSMGGGGGEPRENTLSFLTAAALIVRTEGWLSKGKAYNEGREHQATANRALDYLTPPRDEIALNKWKKWHDEIPVTADDKDVANKALDYARDVLSEKADRSDYEHNLYVATLQNSINYKLAGITASLIPYYLREVERKAIREAELRRVGDSKHLGAVGERLILDVECAKVFVVGENNQWGPSFLHKLITAEGDLVIWFASGDQKMTPGNKYNVKATVKKHDVRDNVKQTIVTRVTRLEPEVAEKEKAKAAKKAARAAKKVQVVTA